RDDQHARRGPARGDPGLPGLVERGGGGHARARARGDPRAPPRHRRAATDASGARQARPVMTEKLQALKMTEHNRRWWTLGAMCFALFMIMLDNTVVNVALPSIQRDLHTTLSRLEWTINAYTLVFAVLLVTGGRLGDIFGRRRMFMFGVIVFGVSSATIGFSPNDA